MKLCFNPNWNNFTDQNWPPFAVPSMRLWDTLDAWANIEKTKGQYDFNLLNSHLAAIAAHGITDVLYTAGKLPSFYSVTDSAAFGNFVKKLAANMAAVWKGTWAFEQWNEPNLSTMWGGTPSQLLAFSRPAYAILKPLGIKVLCPPGSGGTAINNFILDYLRACSGNYPFDIFSYHVYLGDKNPDPTNGLNLLLNDIKVKKSTFGISAMETWLTEGSWGRVTDYNPALNDLQTAAWITTASPVMDKWNVKRFYFYAYDNDRGFGVLATGNPPVLNLAGMTFQALAAGATVPVISTVNIPVPATQINQQIVDTTPEAANHSFSFENGRIVLRKT